MKTGQWEYYGDRLRLIFAGDPRTGETVHLDLKPDGITTEADLLRHFHQHFPQEGSGENTYAKIQDWLLTHELAVEPRVIQELVEIVEGKSDG